jgi:predicted HicB family RNase H-like nuclease
MKKRITMTEKLNLRIDKQQKFELRKKAIQNNMTLSKYVKDVLFKLNEQQIKYSK